MFTTANRELENFFYVHDIRCIRYYTGHDLLTVWEFEDTPYLQEVLAEYKAVVARRRSKNVLRVPEHS